MWRLQEILAEVTGLDAVVAPAGRGLAGRADRPDARARVLRRPRRDEQRRKVVIPDTAHGTNPAQRDDGRLRARARRRPTRAATSTSRTCAARSTSTRPALMLTNPSTLGLFDENIEEIERDLPRRRRAHVLRRREPERRAAASRGPATWASTSSTSTCTRRSRSRTAAAARAAGRSRCARCSSRSCPCRSSIRKERRHVPARLRPAEVDRQGARLHRPVRRLRPLVRVHAHVRARACARCRRRRC